jgi:hypothetical protein
MRRVARAAILTIAVLAARPAWSETVTVKLVNGDVVTGEVIERTADTSSSARDLRAAGDPESRISADTLHPGILGTRFLEAGTELDVGFSGSEGDTDEADVLAGITLAYTDERRHWELDGRYELSYADNDIDDHNAKATVLRDHLFPESRWFFFNYLGYDYDDYEAWEHRVSTGMGPGYRIIPKGAFQLTARAGPFLTYEFGDEDDARPEGAFGLFARMADGVTGSIETSAAGMEDPGRPRAGSSQVWRGQRVRQRVRGQQEQRYYTALNFDSKDHDCSTRFRSSIPALCDVLLD